jgi:hypothetical protein
MVVATLLKDLTTTKILATSDSDWQECLNVLSHDFYHLPGYLELEAIRHNATAEAIVIQDRGQIFFLPYLIRDCQQISISTRCGDERIYDAISPYGYPGMLVNTTGQNAEFISKCFRLIIDLWRSKNICSAFIRLHPLLNSYIDRSMLGSSDRSNSDLHQLDLCNQGNVVICDLTKDPNDIWKGMRANHRSKINKLNRAGFTVRMGSLAENLDVFIDIYRETMDRVNATSSYYFSRDYFTSLAQTLGPQLNLCMVEIDGQVVAASLITEVCGIVQYHLGGTKTEFLPKSPATIMFDYIIKWSQSRNNRYLNLGGGLGGEQDSLYHFKAGFSSQSQPFMTIRSIVNEDLYEHLTDLRANSLGTTTLEIKSKSFFPAYRSL